MLVLRDDDVNFFTEVSQLEKFVSLLPPNVPIILGLVPLIRPSVCAIVPPHYWSSTEREYPMTDNKALCTLLKELVRNGKVVPALHGISHQYKPNIFGKMIPEFYHSKISHKDLSRATSVIKEATGISPTIFIPPGNKISPHNYNMIKKSFQYILNSPSFLTPSRPLRVDHFLRWLLRISSPSKFLQRSPFKTNALSEIASIDFKPFSNLEEIVAGINAVSKPSNLICLATHYWEVANDDPRLGFNYQQVLKLILDQGLLLTEDNLSQFLP
jgi:hypothetical protein